MITILIRSITVLFLLLSPIKIFSQDIFSTTNIKIKTPNSKEAVTITDNEQNIYAFFVGRSNIFYTKTNSKGETVFSKEFDYKVESPQKNVNSKRPTKSSSRFLVEGNYLTDKNKPTLLFSNDFRTKFFTIVFPSTNDEEPIIENFEIKNKKEKHFTSISGKNKVFIYKYPKNSSLINVYEISRNIDKIEVLDLSKERFYNKDNKTCNLSNILKLKKLNHSDNIMSFGRNALFGYNYFNVNNNLKSERFEPQNFKNNNSLPSSIEIASRKIKIYAVANEHIITLNHRKSVTRIISINSDNKEFKVTHLNIPVEEFKSELTFVKSNSFIFKDKIYQLICSRHRLHISAHKIVGGELIKEYKFLKNDDLTILNSPIIQKGGTYMFGGERTLEKTSQLLRKLSNAQNTGLFVYEHNGSLNLTIGGYSEVTTTGVGFGGMNMGGFGSTTLANGLTVRNYSNPTFGAYNSYNYSKSVRAKCLFDIETFEHIEGKVEKNIFDEASSHAERIRKQYLSKTLTLETIFKYKDFFIQGYYNRKNKEYILYKFN